MNLFKLFKSKDKLPVQVSYWRQKFNDLGEPEIHLGLSANTLEAADFIDGMSKQLVVNNYNKTGMELVISGIQWNEKTRDFTLFTSWRKIR